MQPIFITGIGTNVGKTIAAAILCEALEADYWKPIQAGFNNGTDTQFVQSVISNKKTIVYAETYKLKLAASPHIAAKEEGVEIILDKIYNDYLRIINNQQLIINNQLPELQTKNSNLKAQTLIIEGAGGLLVPLNKNKFVIDLIKKLNAKVILISRNYLGSINHSLLTAAICKQHNINVAGWIFNDQYLDYENEIVQWSGYKKIAHIPFEKNIGKEFITQQATALKNVLNTL